MIDSADTPLPENATQQGILSWIWTAILALCVAIIASLGIAFQFPQIGLDPSWEQALVEATDKGRVFGRDIIFTYGPLHQLATNQISENLFPLLFGRFLFAVGWASLVIIVCRLLGVWRGAALVLLIAFLQSRIGWTVGKVDVLIYLFFLLTVLSSYVYMRNNFFSLGLDITILIACTVSLSALLIKLSFLGAAIPVWASVSFYTLFKDAGFRAKTLLRFVLFCTLPIAGLFCIWHLSTNQPLTYMSHYFSSYSFDIILGYTDAMSVSPGPREEILSVFLFLLNIFILIAFSWEFIINPALYGDTEKPARVDFPALVSLLFVLFLSWIVFKVSFVRHDIHVITAGQFLIAFLALTIIFSWASLRSLIRVRQTRSIVASFIMFIFCSGIILSYAYGWRPTSIKEVFSSFGKGFSYLQLAVSEAKRFELYEQRKLILRNLSKKAEKLEIPLSSTADIIPWDISDLLANNLLYTPRPVPQSFTAYTKRLQQINQSFFTKENEDRPNYVIINPKDIDFRVPSSLDSATIRSVIEEYSYSHNGSHGSLIFKQRDAKRNIEGASCILDERKVGKINWSRTSHNAWISNPIDLSSNKANWLSVELEGTFYRRILSFLYKPLPLRIVYLNFEGNVIHSYRLIPKAIHRMLIYPVLNNPAKLREISIWSNPLFAANEKLIEPVEVRLITESQFQPFRNGCYNLEITSYFGVNDNNCH